jgi:peptide/nickel transport system permease protein
MARKAEDLNDRHALQLALEYLKEGRQDAAASILARILKRDPRNERAWHMLSYALQEREKQIYALERVLALNPANRAAAHHLRRLQPSPVAARDDARTEPARKHTQAAAAIPAAAAPLPAEGTGRAPAQPLPPTAGPPGRTPASIGPAGGTQAGAAAIPLPVYARSGARHSSWTRLQIRARLWWQRFKLDWAAFSESKLAILGLIIILFFAVLAIAHPILMRTVWPRGIYDPVTGFDMEVFPHPSPSSTRHIFGTDSLGRDVLSMLLAATTPTFVLGLTAALATAIVGTILSVIAAYFRGPADAIITNLADVFLLFPAPVIMVIIGARFRNLGPMPLGMIYGFVTGAGGTVLVMRAHALQVMARPYMEAAHIAGGGGWHMITKHLLPAMMPLAALQMMIAVTGAVVADGFISFFGLTRVSSNWGTLIYDAFVYAGISSASVSVWHMLLPAAICFSLFALGFYLVSRGLHRVASPIIRREQTRV